MNTSSFPRRWWLACVLLLLAASGVASAQTRAWLDRDQITDADTVTLTIESDSGTAPDYTPLRTDFNLGAQTSSRQVEWSNGAMRTRTVYALELSPRRSGALQVPALQVGTARTAPLALQVGASTSAPAQAQASGNAVVFLETEVDDSTPYVQQSVGVVVRLYYATQLLSGELDLEAPDGASLQRVGEDRSLVREVNGRRYNVVERRFLLIPERSGPLQLPAAQFNGRSAGSLFNDMFGGDRQLRAASPVRALQVQAQPASAPQPWLPLHGLRLRYTAAPSTGRTGEAATVVVEAIARGATRAQFPELPTLDVGTQAQVFAEPPQYDETFDGSTPQLKLTRRYSIVPRSPGTLAIPGPRMTWWDVSAGAARTASLPDLTLAVTAGAGAAPPPPQVYTHSPLPGGARAALSNAVPLGTGAPAAWPWPWVAATAGLGLLWLLTLLWGWRRGRRPAGAVAAAAPGLAPRAAAPGRTVSRAELRRALESEGLDEIIALLAAMGGVQGLDALLARLDDPAQREALLGMQRVRWAGQGGDVAAARQTLRRAFHDGPRWQPGPAAGHTGLAPLYPP